MVSEKRVCVLGGMGRQGSEKRTVGITHASHKLLAKKERGKEGMSERERLSEREKAEQPLHAPYPHPP